MPRATQARETAIIQFFRLASLEVASLVLKLATDEVKARQVRSTEAKERATAAQKKAQKAAEKAQARTPKPPTGKKAAGKKPAAAKKPAAKPLYNEQDLNGDDAGAQD